MKKVGLWFYRNDGGAVTEKILAEKLRKKGYEVIDDFDMRKCYILDGNVYTETGYNLSQLDVFYHMNADEQTEYQRDVLKVLYRPYDSVVYNLIIRYNRPVTAFKTHCRP